MSEDLKQLLREVDEVFDYFVRSIIGPDDCKCGECRTCFAWEVSVRLAEILRPEKRDGTSRA